MCIFRRGLVHPVRVKACFPLKSFLTEVYRTTLMSNSRGDLASGNKAQLKKKKKKKFEKIQLHFFKLKMCSNFTWLVIPERSELRTMKNFKNEENPQTT